MTGDVTFLGVSNLSTLGKIMHGIQEGSTLSGVTVKGALPIVDMRTGKDLAANAERHDELVQDDLLRAERRADQDAREAAWVLRADAELVRFVDRDTAASDQAKLYHGEVATPPLESPLLADPDSFAAPTPSLYPHRPVHIDAPDPIMEANRLAMMLAAERHEERHRLQNLGLAPDPHAGRDGLEGVNARIQVALADAQRTGRELEKETTRLRMELRAVKAQLSDSPPLTQSREASYLLQINELTAAVTAWQRTHARHLEDVRTERQRMRHALVTALALLPADQVATALAVLPPLPPSDTPAETVKP